MQERTITVTTSDLAAACREWDAEAKAKGFAQRADDARFKDTATYLLDKVVAIQARRHAD